MQVCSIVSAACEVMTAAAAVVAGAVGAAVGWLYVATAEREMESGLCTRCLADEVELAMLFVDSTAQDVVDSVVNCSRLYPHTVSAVVVVHEATVVAPRSPLNGW